MVSLNALVGMDVSVSLSFVCVCVCVCDRLNVCFWIPFFLTHPPSSFCYIIRIFAGKGDHCEIHIYALEDEYPQHPKCGEDRVCLNGGQCTETQVIKANDTVEMEYHCDCSTAFDDKFQYAGESCQFSSTQICTHDGDTMEGRLFCANHGSCQDDPEQGCKCPGGFEGFSCEFEKVDEDPTDRESSDFGKCGNNLVCHNGGVCVTTLLYTQDGGEQELNHCDCSTAATDTTAWVSSLFRILPFCLPSIGVSYTCEY
jgi:hypothetical protein